MRVAIYLRCASPDRASFEEQRNHCLAYAAQAGYEVVAVYEDFGRSGMRDDRPGLQEMLAAAQASSFDAIIVDQIYRLSRNWMYLVYYQEQLESYNVSIKVAQGGSVA